MVLFDLTGLSPRQHDCPLILKCQDQETGRARPFTPVSVSMAGMMSMLPTSLAHIDDNRMEEERLYKCKLSFGITVACTGSRVVYQQNMSMMTIVTIHNQNADLEALSVLCRITWFFQNELPGKRTCCTSVECVLIRAVCHLNPHLQAWEVCPPRIRLPGSSKRGPRTKHYSLGSMDWKAARRQAN